MTLKESHELAVIRRALACLSIPYTDLRPGKEGEEPDGVLQSGREVLGIEVTDAFYTAEHARVTWQPARDAQRGALRHLYRTGVIEEFDKQLSREVSEIIRKKEAKRYSGVGRLVLLVHLHASLTEEEHIDRIVESLRPRTCALQFSELWIGWSSPDGKYEVWRV